MSTPPGMAPTALQPFDEDFQSVMCVVAHPDDIEYGLSAAVDRWVKQGKTVTYLLASRGEAGIDTLHPDEAGPVREAEEIAAGKAVGVEIVDFLDFRDGAPRLQRRAPRRLPKPRELVTMILGMAQPATGLPCSLAFERLEA